MTRTIVTVALVLTVAALYLAHVAYSITTGAAHVLDMVTP